MLRALCAAAAAGAARGAGGWAEGVACDAALSGAAGSADDVDVAVTAPAPATGYPTVRVTTKRAMEYVVRVAPPDGCGDCYGSYELKLVSADALLRAQTGAAMCPPWPPFQGGNADNNTITAAQREGTQWYNTDSSREPATRELSVTGVAGAQNSRFVVTVAYRAAGRAVKVVRTAGADYVAQPQPAAPPGAPTVTYEGYVIDMLCVLRTQQEPGWVAPDLTLALTEPEAHHVWCLNLDVCVDSGYGLVERASSGRLPYALKYRLDKAGNAMVAAATKGMNATDVGVKVRATGVEAAGGLLAVSRISVTSAAPPPQRR